MAAWSAGASLPQVHRAAASISPQARAQERHASTQRCMHVSPPPPPASAAMMPWQSSAHASHTLWVGKGARGLRSGLASVEGLGSTGSSEG